MIHCYRISELCSVTPHTGVEFLPFVRVVVYIAHTHNISAQFRRLKEFLSIPLFPFTQSKKLASN